MSMLEEQMKTGLLRWYDFREHSILYVDGDDGILAAYLQSEGHQVITTEDLAHYEGRVDYIVSLYSPERVWNPVELLEQWKRCLAPHGKLLLGMHNRLAAKNFCGDVDPYTKQVFDGVEEYVAYGQEALMQQGGRCYSKAEIEHMLSDAGYEHYQQYTVLPSVEMPQLVYREDVLPEEDLAMRYIPFYENASGVFLNEGKLYDGLIANGLFHMMANAFFYECSLDEKLSDVQQVTLSMDRGEERSVITVMRENTVEKHPVYAAGREKLQEIERNHERIAGHGLSVLRGEWKNHCLTMPRVRTQLANVYLQNLLTKDVDAYLAAMDHFRDCLLQSSEIVGENEYGSLLHHGYFDMVPLNAFVEDGEFRFYDQEFAIENFPMNAILYRAIVIVYDGNMQREMRYPSYKMFERYGMSEHLEDYTRMTQEFLLSLRNQEHLAEFNRLHARDLQNVQANRERIQVMTRKSMDIQATCFDNIENKKIVVFGSGKYADKFMALYASEYDIMAVVDNNVEKHGQVFRGVQVQSPEILRAMKTDYYKVIICVKNYQPIYEQLLDMGVVNIGAYDFNRVYAGRQVIVPTLPPSDKKYHIGYCAGVYDLFHIGHVNIFRRAKERCDYLVVGVVSDECVQKNKHKEPFIPFEERIEMVRSCKYVDEAVEIPYGYERSIEAFEKLHFDCQFSGSDYEHDEGWLYIKRWLEERGSELEFFPYTEQTSSTKIKGLIEKGLV